jgi:hypothetical protein
MGPSSQATREDQQTGWYVYGILPGDVELNSEIRGIGDPPAKVRLVHSGELAALVSEVKLSAPLGSPEDLQSHMAILDSSAAGAPVLPLRFGAVVSNEDAVVEELLEPHRDEFVAALEELEGSAEYVVAGRYVEQVILREILSEDPEAADLADQVRGTDPDATRDLRIRLGELIGDAVAAKRAEDTRVFIDAVQDLCKATFVREPSHELDAVYVAVLIPADRVADLERAVDDLAGDRWKGRVELRILGPMAPYDFVGTAEARG